MYASDNSNEEGSEIFPFLACGRNDKIYFDDLKAVYFRKTEKNEIGKKGQLKKLDCVFKSKHACFYCGKFICKPVEHLEEKHSEEKGMKEILQLTKEKDVDAHRKNLVTMLRNKGNHKHNLAVIEAESGELLLSRRPQGEGSFLAASYKPCPSCFAWVSNLAKHRSYTDRCVAKEGKLTKREVQLKADVHTGHHKGAIKELQDEVLAKMSDDSISQISKKDHLIIELGNASMRRNMKNELRRGSYASCKMRLCSMILKQLREMGSADDANASWDDMLMPEKFKMVVKAVAVVSGATADSFDHPSNALKSSYYIKEMANIKETLAMMSIDKDKAEEARLFHAVCEKNWITEVSALACATLRERSFNKVVELPKPADLKKLSQHLQDEAGKIAVIESEDSYRYAIEVTEARLLTYNKRRPGELHSIR